MKIGAHVSSAGKIYHAIDKATAIGAECIQLFPSAPQRWLAPKHSDGDVALFREKAAAAGSEPVYFHGDYLINLCTPREDLFANSVASLSAYLTFADKLGAAGVIFHLGSSVNTTLELAEDGVCRGLERLLAETPGEAAILIETSAGQGNTLGSKFGQIGHILDRLGRPPRLQVCLDTAHVFASGYDIRTAEGLDAALREFDQTIGLDLLKAIHANDSKAPLGSGVDRHQNIGEGYLGEAGFKHIMTHPAFAEVPFLLEVPGYTKEGPDAPNIDALRRLAGLPALERPEPGRSHPGGTRPLQRPYVRLR